MGYSKNAGQMYIFSENQNTKPRKDLKTRKKKS